MCCIFAVSGAIATSNWCVHLEAMATTRDGNNEKVQEEKKVKISKTATLQIAATSPFPLVVMEKNCDRPPPRSYGSQGRHVGTACSQ